MHQSMLKAVLRKASIDAEFVNVWFDKIKTFLFHIIAYLFLIKPTI